MPLVASDPGIGRDVGDRVFPGQIFALAQLFVEHAIQTQRFFAKTFDGVGNFFFKAVKIIGLAEHGPDSAHLKHQPLNHQIALPQVGRPELAGLLRQIHQDRARLEKRERLTAGTFGVDDRRNFVVRIDRQILRLELVVLTEIDRIYFIRHADLFEHNRNFFTVGRAPSVEFNHRLILSRYSLNDKMETNEHARYKVSVEMRYPL